jgi:hypothetical protein
MDAKMKNVTMVALTFAYTIFIVLLYGKTFTLKYLEKYTTIVTICTATIAFILFYFLGTTNFLTSQQLVMEQIKTVVLFLCFGSLVWAYYFYFQNISSYTTILTGLITFVGFLYTILMLSLKGNNERNSSPKSKPLLFGTLVAGISSVFVLLETANIINWTNASLSILIVSCLVSLTIFASLLLAFIVGPNLGEGISLETANKACELRKLFAKLLGILSGLTIFPVLFAWLGLWIPLWLKKSFEVPHGLMEWYWLVVKLVLLSGSAIALKKYAGQSSTAIATDIASTANTVSNKAIKTSQIIGTTGTIVGCALLFSVTVLPLIKHAKFAIQGGKKLVGDTAHPLNKQLQVATYDNISSYGSNQTIPQSYAYGLSFWFYVNSMAPNTSLSYSKFVSILNHGNRPNILYKGNTNTLMITMRNNYDGELLPSELSSLNNNERIIHTHKNILMQRWNHIAVNYSFGTMDVFINGELVKSVPGVVPFSIPDNTTVGEDNGLHGGIRNVIYFDKPITANNLKQLCTI